MACIIIGECCASNLAGTSQAHTHTAAQTCKLRAVTLFAHWPPRRPTGPDTIGSVAFTHRSLFLMFSRVSEHCRDVTSSGRDHDSLDQLWPQTLRCVANNRIHSVARSRVPQSSQLLVDDDGDDDYYSNCDRPVQVSADGLVAGVTSIHAE